MDAHRKIRESVFNGAPRDIGDKTDHDPDKLTGFIGWLQDVLETVPEQYRAAAEIEIEGHDDWPRVEITISYLRPESDRELTERVAAADARAAGMRQLDLELLAALKAKYDG